MGRQHETVKKLRNKSHHMDLVLDIAKDLEPNEVKVLEHLREWLLDRADEVESLYVWEKFKKKYPKGWTMFTTEAGYRAIIYITDRDILCGYLEIGKDHPYYGYEDLDSWTGEGDFLNSLDVHGGITYAGPMTRHIYPKDQPMDIDHLQRLAKDNPKNVFNYAIGFDCCHSSVDYIPGYNDTWLNEDSWRDEKFVRENLEYLAEQMKEHEGIK